jgi:hypothetical protein
MNFKISLSSFSKGAVGILIEFALSQKIDLMSTVFLKIKATVL